LSWKYVGSGCDELGSVGDDHHVLGLQGERGGALPGHGGMWAVVVMSLVVLGMTIMYEDYTEREVVLCLIMEVCGQW
jgi:hypothetical protein